MSDLIQRQLDDLGKMTTGDLVQRYEDLHGHKCRTRHRAYLIRKFAWRIQANAEGGLSERARKRAAELADLAASSAVRAHLPHEIELRASALAPHERVRRIAVLPEPFSVARGEVTSNQKLRRRALAERHHAVVDALYRQEGP